MTTLRQVLLLKMHLEEESMASLVFDLDGR